VQALARQRCQTQRVMGHVAMFHARDPQPELGILQGLPIERVIFEHDQRVEQLSQPATR